MTAPPTRPFQILLVEDSRGDRRLVQEYLAAAGPGVYSCTGAETLAEARSLLAADGIDLVLLDLGLPDSWGLETLQEVRKISPRVPIVVLSGTVDEELALKAIQAGAHDYLVKGPITKTAILRTVRYTIERHRLENALRASEEKFRTIADFTLDWEYWLGPAGEILYMSPSCHTITGYQQQEFIDDPGLLERIVHPADRPAFLAHQQTAKNDWPWMPHGEIEFRIQRRDGGIRWIGHVCRSIFSPEGIYGGRRASNRDISERYETMQKLARARDFYLTLLEDFPALIWRCAPDGRYNWFNRRWLEFTGRSLEQEVGLGAVDRIHPQDVDGYLRTFRESLAALAPFHAEYRLRAANGAWRWVIDTGHPITDIDQQFAGYIGSCIDITARKEAEHLAQLNESRMVSLLEISHFPSRSTKDLLDFALQEAINLTGSTLGYLVVRDADRDVFQVQSWSRTVMQACEINQQKEKIESATVGHWSEVVRRRASIIVNDRRLDHPQSPGAPAGHVPLTRWMSIPLIHDERIVAVIGLANKAEDYVEIDVLQTTLLMEGVWRVKVEREAVEEVRRLNADLEERVASRTAELASAIRELESFAYSVSHDLRAPLRSIEGFSHALREEYGALLDQTGRDYLGRISGASLRMAKLIDDLLQLSRVARHPLELERVDLSKLAAELIDDLRRETPDREVAVVIEPDLIVQADPHLLQIALGNLLGNAWKFTAKTTGARITFGARRRDGQREFFVRDNGAGFDPTYAGKLFVPFQRLHSAAEYPGTGVGLTIIQRIIRRHRGQIRGDGRPGEGAEFAFTLPEPS